MFVKEILKGTLNIAVKVFKRIFGCFDKKDISFQNI